MPDMQDIFSIKKTIYTKTFTALYPQGTLPLSKKEMKLYFQNFASSDLRGASVHDHVVHIHFVLTPSINTWFSCLLLSKVKNAINI